MLRLPAAVASLAVLAPAAHASGDDLRDIQIGEAPDRLRVALVCKGPCAVERLADGTFLIDGVEETLTVDLSGRSARAERLVLTPEVSATRLSVVLATPAGATSISRCDTGEGPATCIDFRFGVQAAALDEGAAPDPATPPPPPAPALRDGDAAPPILGVLTPLAPDPSRLFSPLPGFPPPERLAPPAPAVAPAPAQKPSQGAGQEAGAAPPAGPARRPFDLRVEAEAIVGRPFDIGLCEGARARLQADPWALGSMVDVAYCKAVAGDLDGADADFERLLAYTPDNFEALTGRGLIAAARGDREAAWTRLQAALDALPPIAESDRIASAMMRL